MNIKPIALLLALTLPLAACGNKGPLVRPSAQVPPVEAPAPSDTATPPDSSTPPPADTTTPPADSPPATTPPPAGNG